ncbi:hypothetical protein [Zoogloea sp.]|uniref:type IV pilus assembly protein FimV n=1 Tax=Zoogloea sp. TaxID=49181 RepID=UPI00141601F6|nr:MAG: hypothetical protein F9K15_15130 [Zoogloea sp.]
MKSARKPLPLLLAALVLPYGPIAGAVGMGELVAHSSLGEPLRAEVRVLRNPGESLDAACVKVVSGAAEDVPWLYTARVRLAGEHLVLTTREPVNHPIAMIGLRIGCGSELRRDFTLLLAPPAIRGITPPTLASTDDTAEPAQVQAPPRVRPARQTPSAIPGGSVDTPATAGAPARRAAAPQDRPAQQRTTARSAAVAPPRPARPLPPVLGGDGDKLLIGAGDEARLVPLRMSTLLANPPRSDNPKADRPALSVEQRTVAEIDDRIAAQLELDEKIKRLEEYQAMLKEKVAQLDASGPAPAAAPAPAAPQKLPQAIHQATLGSAAPAPTASTPADTQGFLAGLPSWAAPLAGLLAVLAGGAALIRLRRGREATDDLTIPTQTDTAGSSGVTSAAPPASTAGEAARPQAHASVAVNAVAERAPVLQEHGDEWVEPTFAPAHPIPFDETVDEHDSALELAEIMMSFGRTQGAAETLADYIRSNPRQAVKPWLKLLEVYHVAGMRAEFEALTRQLNKTFNVKMIGWSDFKVALSTPESIEQMPHLVARLQELWGTQEAQIYIHQILRDNRNGTRQGFPLAVVEELLLMLAVLDDQLGTYKPPTELSLAEMERPNNAENAAAA